MNDLPISTVRLARLEGFIFRWPISTPVRTSFGEMRDRPALFVRAEDTDGAVGWGEIWCNFPSCGAEHRANLLSSVLAPLAVGRIFSSPVSAFRTLTAATEVLGLQSSEPGPIAQTIAGIDIALWDLCARRAGQPLWAYLGGGEDVVGVYASGVNPEGCQRLVLQKLEEGYEAFKLKIGFNAESDLDNLRALREAIGERRLMADANQAWNLAEALSMAPRLAEFNLSWLEEPLRADRPLREWLQLSRQSVSPLAAGENIAGEAAFANVLKSRALSVVQPDIAKWGGISGCWPVIGMIRDAGATYCPHYLGAGIGLQASGHLLAAVGGGLLEVDANENPLRTDLSPMLHSVERGSVRLGASPGIGVEVDLERIADSVRRVGQTLLT